MVGPRPHSWAPLGVSVTQASGDQGRGRLFTPKPSPSPTSSHPTHPLEEASEPGALLPDLFPTFLKLESAGEAHQVLVHEGSETPLIELMPNSRGS